MLLDLYLWSVTTIVYEHSGFKKNSLKRSSPMTSTSDYANLSLESMHRCRALCTILLMLVFNITQQH